CRSHRTHKEMRSMQAEAAATLAIPSRRVWTSRILTALPTLFLVFDAAIKLVKIDAVTESMGRLGYPDSLSRAIGALELACVVASLVPRTAVLGVILLTGFLGGAVATHVRVGDPLISHVLFPIYVGALLWAGLYLRDPRARALVDGRR